MKRTSLQDRYELREVLGRGGMGVVYKAWDTLMKREVALKTILEVDNPDTIALFYKEWNLLSTMVHPNIVAIYDIGEFTEDGATKPFFVMPLLPGVTLDKLIKEGSPRLSVPGVVEIIDQAARGLYAAHEQGLVHRDVKPSNIFVMEDNSVKIIDFGIARSSAASTKTSLKGTVFYLPPELLQMKPATPLSDLFALGVVTYEALTRRRPFQGPTDAEVIEAIQKQSPPPVSEINHNASYLISQVVHKAIAKQPWHRFFNTREFGEALQKALRNESLPYFDSTKIKPRLDRAVKSFEQGDYAFASEILSEMEAEGHLDQDIVLLRRQLDQAMRQTRIQQLLDSARRFFEATEYPLALRKIQEALDLDPNDPGALSLKGQVEKERREKKIEEWIALAAQHLENQAFRQAREALDNVIRLKPNETEALRLLAEIGRREQEVTRVREEKARLYQAAMQSWESGDVTSALSKLEVLIALNRDQPESDTSLASSYQNFYNQVHSEHNALRNAYEEARRNLSANNFEAAHATCKQYLSKYPNHALFQALKFDVEERQRHNLSAVIAETDRRIEQEPDLDRRIGVLEEAQKLYPGEAHFEQAMRLARDKRDLVNSIVAKARFFEERGQFNEALDQWQILRSIHENQPGLAFEIQRLMNRRDQHARERAKVRWVEQIDKYLEAGDYDRAMKSVEGALAEFPGDAELLELDKLARKNQERGKQALELLDRAREAGEKGSFDQSLPLLREAYQLDPPNMVVRTILVNSLSEHARRLADSDWEAADSIVQEVLKISPQHAPAVSLAAQITDRKREELVAGRLSQARRLQTDGDIEGAVAVITQGLESYPNEPRLQQLGRTLERAQAEAQRQAPSPPTAELKPPKVVMPAFAPMAAAAAPAPAMQPPPPPPATNRSSKNLYIAIGALAGVVVFAGVRIVQPRSTAPSAAGAHKVTLHSSPGAVISIAGKPCGTSFCEIQLPPGDYQAEAALAGYDTARAPFQVEAGKGAVELNLALTPASATLTLSSDLAGGAVTLNGASIAQLQSGELEVANLPPGSHTLAIQSGTFKVSIPMEIPAGGMPKLSAPMETANLKTFVVASYGSDARVYSSLDGFQVSMDGKPAGAVTSAGLDVAALAPGPHVAVLTGPNNQQKKIAFESGNSAVVFAALVTDPNLGALRVMAGDDDVGVYVNGERYRRATKKGSLLLYLTPKKYSIRVEKQGFASPPERIVELRKGEESKVEFRLLPLRAALSIRSAPTGTEVWVDGARIGTVRADGGFSYELDPGRHTVALRHDRSKPLQSEHVFLAGRTVEMEGKLEAALGTVKIDVNPAGAETRLRLHREGEAQDREVNDTTLMLAEGTYTITGSSRGYQDATATVRVTPNRTATVALVLKRVERPVAKQEKPPFLLDDWMKAGGWTRNATTITRRGGDIVLAPVSFQPGSVTFTVILLRGKRIEWLLNFQNNKNYCLFQFDDKNYERMEYVNGKRSSQVKIPHGANKKDFVSINVAVKADSIVHSIQRGGTWQLLDTWQRSTGSPRGPFGFRLPGGDEIGLSDFRLLPE